MATTFPTTIDTLSNPSASDNLNTVGVKHADQHINANDAIEAIEAKVGVDGSAVTTSHDYLIAQLQGTKAGATWAFYGGKVYMIHPSSGDWHELTPVLDGGGNLTFDIDQTGITPLA